MKRDLYGEQNGLTSKDIASMFFGSMQHKNAGLKQIIIP